MRSNFCYKKMYGNNEHIFIIIIITHILMFYFFETPVMRLTRKTPALPLFGTYLAFFIFLFQNSKFGHTGKS